MCDMIEEAPKIDYLAILQHTSHLDDNFRNPVLPARRFVKAVLKKEAPQISSAVVAFADAACKIELGIGPQEYHLQQAVKVAEMIGTTADEMIKASEVARNLWGEYKKLTGIASEPVRVYEALNAEAAEAIQKLVQEQRLQLQKQLASTEQVYPEETIPYRESLTRKHMVALVARKTGLKKKVTEEIIDAFLDELVGQMLDGKRIVLTGFGTFQVAQRNERKISYENEEILIPAHKYPHFTPSKTLKR